MKALNSKKNNYFNDQVDLVVVHGDNNDNENDSDNDHSMTTTTTHDDDDKKIIKEYCYQTAMFLSN